MKRALVISGGGSKGAFGGGIAEYLIKEQERDYQLYVGTSTGSLLVCMLAVEETDSLREAFTKVTQKDIFDVNPFKIVKDKYGESAEIHHWNVLRQFMRKRKTFGESNNLRITIANVYTEEVHNKLIKSGKEVWVTVSNLSTDQMEYIAIHECSYEDAVDWIWISCNFAPFMSVVRKNYYEYADGGYSSYVAIDKAFVKDVEEIDVIVLETEQSLVNHLNFNNAFSLMFRLFDFMFNRIMIFDLRLAKLKAKETSTTLNIFFIPNVLTTNALFFKPDKMRKWWTKGYNYAMKNFNQNKLNGSSEKDVAEPTSA